MGGRGGKRCVGREDERPTSRPLPSLGGVSEELVQCLLFTPEARRKLQSLAKLGGGMGHVLPRSLETRPAKATCVPGTPFQKRLVRPVPSETGSDGGLPGSHSHLSPWTPPQRGALAPGPTGSCYPWTKGHPS